MDHLRHALWSDEPGGLGVEAGGHLVELCGERDRALQCRAGGTRAVPRPRGVIDGGNDVGELLRELLPAQLESLEHEHMKHRDQHYDCRGARQNTLAQAQSIEPFRHSLYGAAALHGCGAWVLASWIGVPALPSAWNLKATVCVPGRWIARRSNRMPASVRSVPRACR